MRRFTLPAIAAVLVAAPLLAQGSRALEARNKQVVLDMWHDVLNGRNYAAAPKYFVEDYVQHSPSAGQGRDAMIAFVSKELGPGPLKPGSYKLTQFDHVLAQGDLVQLMFKRHIADPEDKSRMIDIWWYDTFRVKDGKIVEHWDSAWK